MLQMLQRLQQHDNDDEAELAETASGSADESDNELSEHIQQKLIMAVRVHAASPGTASIPLASATGNHSLAGTHTPMSLLSAGADILCCGIVVSTLPGHVNGALAGSLVS